MMLFKAVLTFLAIGTLWVNVLATPIPAIMHIRDPSDSQPAESGPVSSVLGHTGHSSDSQPAESGPVSSVLGRTDHSSDSQSAKSGPGSSALGRTGHSSDSDGGDRRGSNSAANERGRQRPPLVPGPVPGNWWQSIKRVLGGELPRSFSALSYRDLTFVFKSGGVHPW